MFGFARDAVKFLLAPSTGPCIACMYTEHSHLKAFSASNDSKSFFFVSIRQFFGLSKCSAGEIFLFAS